MLVPEFSGAEDVSVFAPVTFHASFVTPFGEGVGGITTLLRGAGTARVDLSWATEDPAWLPASAGRSLPSA